MLKILRTAIDSSYRSVTMPAQIQSFLDPASKTYTYVVYEHDGGQCAVIDPVLDYDPASGRSGTEQADRVIAFVTEHQLTVQWLLETHAHADRVRRPLLARETGRQDRHRRIDPPGSACLQGAVQP